MYNTSISMQPGGAPTTVASYGEVDNIKGEAKKTSLNSQHRFCSISLTKNILEGWDIIHWKGRIHSFVWSTKTFLYDIWEPRYKQIKMGSQISKCLNMEKFCVWKSDNAAIYA